MSSDGAAAVTPQPTVHYGIEPAANRTPDISGRRTPPLARIANALPLDMGSTAQNERYGPPTPRGVAAWKSADLGLGAQSWRSAVMRPDHIAYPRQRGGQRGGQRGRHDGRHDAQHGGQHEAERQAARQADPELPSSNTHSPGTVSRVHRTATARHEFGSSTLQHLHETL